MGSSQSNRIATANQSGSKQKGTGCQDCVKQGIPVLPVLESNLMVSRQGAYQVNGKATVTRMPKSGYLYVYYKAKNDMQCYVVGKDGCIRKVDDPNKANPDASKVAMSSQCKSSGHASPTRYITINKNDAKSGVAIAFSHYKWTANVINKYKSNAALRQKRMLEIANVNAQNSKNSYSDLSQGNGFNACANFSTSKVNAYNSKQQLIIDSLTDKIKGKKKREQAQKPLVDSLFIHDLQAQKRDLQNSMNKVAKAAGSKPFMVVLPDPVGKMKYFNDFKNYHTAKIAEYSQGTTPKEHHERVVAGIIKKILEDADKSGKKHYTSKRYLKHIKVRRYGNVIAAVNSAEQSVKSHKYHSQKLLPYFKDTLWKTIQAHDFDGKSALSTLDHREMIHDVFTGMGSQKAYDDVIEPMLTQTVAKEDNWLIRVFGSLNTEMMAIFEAALKKYETNLPTVLDISQGPRVYETGKAVSTAVIEFFNSYGHKIPDLSTRKGNLAIINESIANTMGAIATELESRSHAATKTIKTPKKVRARYHQISSLVSGFAASSQRQIFLPVVVTSKSATRLLDLHSRLHSAPTSGEVDDAFHRLKMHQKLSDKDVQAMTYVVMRKLMKGEKPSAAFIKRLNLKEVDIDNITDMPSAHKLTQQQIDRAVGKASKGLAIGLGVIQSYAYVLSVRGVIKAKTNVERASYGLSAANAAFTATSALVEIQAANALLKGKSSTVVANLGLKASLYGAGAALMEFGFNLTQGISGFKRGDTDYALYALANAATSVVMGGAFLGFGISAAYAAAGGSAAGASVVVLGKTITAGSFWLALGPWGWLALAVTATAVSLYLYYQMHGSNDNNLLPVEYWLDMGVFGRRNHVRDVNNPMANYTKTGKFNGLVDELNGMRLLQYHFDPDHHIQSAGMGYTVKASVNVSKPEQHALVGVGVHIYQPYLKRYVLAYRMMYLGSGKFQINKFLPDTFFNYHAPKVTHVRDDVYNVSFSMQFYGSGGMGARSNKKQNQCTAIRLKTLYLPDKRIRAVKYKNKKEYGIGGK